MLGVFLDDLLLEYLYAKLCRRDMCFNLSLHPELVRALNSLGFMLFQPCCQLLQCLASVRNFIFLCLIHLRVPISHCQSAPASTAHGNLKDRRTYVCPSYSNTASHPKSPGPRAGTIFPYGKHISILAWAPSFLGYVLHGMPSSSLETATPLSPAPHNTQTYISPLRIYRGTLLIDCSSLRTPAVISTHSIYCRPHTWAGGRTFMTQGLHEPFSKHQGINQISTSSTLSSHPSTSESWGRDAHVYPW